MELLVSHIIGAVKHFESEAQRRLQYTRATGSGARGQGSGGLVRWDWWLEELSRVVSPFVFEKSRRFAERLGAEAHRLGFGPVWATMMRRESCSA